MSCGPGSAHHFLCTLGLLGETPLRSPGLGEGYSEKALTQDTQTLKAVAATAHVPPSNFQ